MPVTVNTDSKDIKEFASRVDRDPGIVLGRLRNDAIVDYKNWTLNSLRHQYKVRMG